MSGKIYSFEALANYGDKSKHRYTVNLDKIVAVGPVIQAYTETHFTIQFDGTATMNVVYNHNRQGEFDRTEVFNEIMNARSGLIEHWEMRP